MGFGHGSGVVFNWVPKGSEGLFGAARCGLDFFKGSGLLVAVFLLSNQNTTITWVVCPPTTLEVVSR